MLKDVMAKLRSLSREPIAFDPASLGDEIATRTEWGPAKSGGASFGTHRLEPMRHDRVEFTAKGGAVAFFGAFLLMGIGIPMVFFVVAARTDAGFAAVALPMLVMAVFVAVGGFGLRSVTAPVVFDRGRGTYWKGRTPPHEAPRQAPSGDHADLDDVYALQIISERCRTKNSSYLSYELNLILKDGSRLNVVDHGNYEQLRGDAETLAEFLKKPLWDAVPQQQS
jgi:hypothetical protein